MNSEKFSQNFIAGLLPVSLLGIYYIKLDYLIEHCQSTFLLAFFNFLIFVLLTICYFLIKELFAYLLYKNANNVLYEGVANSLGALIFAVSFTLWVYILR